MLKMNKHVILSERPGVNNAPSSNNLSVETYQMPLHLRDGEIMVKTLYLSVDPYMRCCMNEDTGVDYVDPWQIGNTITGGGVGVVIQSRNEAFAVGDIVESFTWPWMLYATLSIENVKKLTKPLPATKFLSF